jgi:uncharacterized protein GlcG (DUF336 family)
MASLADARRVIAAAEKEAAEIGQPMNIAVADEGGNIVAHVRMDGAWIGSIDISQKKPTPPAPSTSPPRTSRLIHDRVGSSLESTRPITARS